MSTSPPETLALHGGPPVLSEGPPGWPPDDADLRAALEAAFADGSWARYEGRWGGELTERLAAMHGLEFVTLCSSGTVAVELALRGLAVGPGDEVILAGYDFPGNFRAIEAVGARPVLVDVDPQSGTLDPRQLDAARSATTRAVVVSHLHGALAPMADIIEQAVADDLQVVEDACQVPGATVDGRPAGAWGDVGVLSFGGSKLLTAGRGGALLTRRADVHQRMVVYSERGNSAFPLSELQAAVLLPQLDKLPARNRRRARAVNRLLAATEQFAALRPVVSAATGETSFYKLAWRYEPASAVASRAEFAAAVRAEGVALDEGFRGFVRRSPRRCRKVGPLDESAAAADATLLLHHPVLLAEDETLDRVATALAKVVEGLGV